MTTLIMTAIVTLLIGGIAGYLLGRFVPRRTKMRKLQAEDLVWAIGELLSDPLKEYDARLAVAKTRMNNVFGANPPDEFLLEGWKETILNRLASETAVPDMFPRDRSKQQKDLGAKPLSAKEEEIWNKREKQATT